ncbi:MAG: site-2 protease family protein [Bacillota bacterium]|nr:site-2 protease family protein [Bacillota bacterium]
MRAFLSNPMALILIAVMAFQALTSGQYSSPLDWLISNLMILPGIVIGLSFHEYAHAVVAYKCGDPTPKRQGRVTINPLAHVDPVGFIALLFIGFGWGKAVVINPRNFRKPRRDELLVSLAGVTMNLLLAFVFMGLFRLLYELAPMFMFSQMGGIVAEILFYIVWINLVLMVFNLLPIPPLDGFGVITQLFNLRGTRFYQVVYQNGFLILMVLILFNITGRILSPAVNALYNLLGGIFF